MAKEGLRGGSPTLPVNVEKTSIAGVRTDIITFCMAADSSGSAVE
jgi:hypothetical protein